MVGICLPEGIDEQACAEPPRSREEMGPPPSASSFTKNVLSTEEYPSPRITPRLCTPQHAVGLSRRPLLSGRPFEGKRRN